MTYTSSENIHAVKTNTAANGALRPVASDIVIDVDDTLWDFSGRISRITGVPLEDMIDFRVNLNDRITPEQQEAMYAAFADPTVFENIEFYPGIEKINNLKIQGLDVKILTGSSSSRIAEMKKPQLAAVLPDLPAGYKVFSRQNILKNNGRILMMVDDNPYEVACSQASCNIMPIRPWNQTEKAMKMVADRNVIYIPAGDLGLLANLIYNTAYQLLREPFRRYVITQTYFGSTRNSV